ncbi:carboxypeptidase regulatory-like domain-containing protein [bacterium]|nr:carboxypeptidase regulatory-like domain-containing protein [bacterium]
MISGKLTANGGQTPAPRMEVTIRGNGRFLRNAMTNQDGNFLVKVVPGSYYLTISGNSGFAPLPNYVGIAHVPTDADPEPLSIAVATATTITGTVIDTQNRPVSGVKVIGTGTEDSCATNSQGEFELSGISTLGTSTIYALDDGGSGVVTISGEELNQPVHLVLGEGLQSGRVVGRTLPKLSLMSLDGAAQIWKASSDQQRLLVIGRLGTAPGRALIARAQQWCMLNDAQLEVISVDWYPEQAQRAQAQHDIAGVIWYGGPDGSNLPEAWKINPQGTVYLVSKEGKVTSSSASGTLPD